MCTKVNCPMQAGVISDDCDSPDCPYRTEPVITDEIFRNILVRNGYDPDLPGSPFLFIIDLLMSNNIDKKVTKEEQEYIRKHSDITDKCFAKDEQAFLEKK